MESLSIIDGLKIALYGFVTVFIMLAALMLIIRILAYVVNIIENRATQAEASKEAPNKVEEVEGDKEFVGDLELVDCDEKTAACIMAIISETSGIPLENLIFKKIELMKEEN